MKVWELSVGVNDYNQHGEYTIALFSEKPSLVRLKEVCSGGYRDFGTPYVDGLSFEDVLIKLLEEGTVSEHPKNGGGDKWYLEEREVFSG